MYLDNFIVAHKQHPPILTRLTLYVVEEVFRPIESLVIHDSCISLRFRLQAFSDSDYAASDPTERSPSSPTMVSARSRTERACLGGGYQNTQKVIDPASAGYIKRNAKFS